MRINIPAEGSSQPVIVTTASNAVTVDAQRGTATNWKAPAKPVEVTPDATGYKLLYEQKCQECEDLRELLRAKELVTWRDQKIIKELRAYKDKVVNEEYHRKKDAERMVE